MSNDVEYLRVAMASGQKKASGPSGPRLSEWTEEVSLLASLVDEVRGLTLVTVKAASQGKSGGSHVEQVPRPKTAMDQLSLEQRLARYHRLTDRVLGKNRKKPPPAQV